VLFQELALDLTGSYQLKNILTVIQSALVLNKLGYRINDQDIRTALRNVKQLTGLQGRWQVLGNHPLIICDTGHNIAGITEVLQNIRETPHDHLHIVIGMVKDKDIGGVLELLPSDARYYFCQPDLERALPAAELARQALDQQLIGDVFQSVQLALTAAKNDASDDDLIFVGGSTFVVAEVL
jgi:dihydrofolate synthase/folylpolyglutamate synthase